MPTGINYSIKPLDALAEFLRNTLYFRQRVNLADWVKPRRIKLCSLAE